MNAENLFYQIEFPNNRWRKTDKKANLDAKKRTMDFVARLVALNMPADEIKERIGNIVWDSFVEHELQVKDMTGKDTKEFYVGDSEEQTQEANK